MKREEKLALLKGIQDGVLTKEHLNQPQVYIFMGEINTNRPKERSDTFIMRGKTYTEVERLEFIVKLEAKNEAMLKLGVFKNSSELQDKHITIAFSN
jgi:hypothetical protein